MTTKKRQQSDSKKPQHDAKDPREEEKVAKARVIDPEKDAEEFF
jgi:hypothetical protein